MIKNRTAPRALVAITAAVVLCAFVAAAYFGYIAYQIRNTTPYERDSDQYNGWLYAKLNQLEDAGQCADTDGGWAALGVDTSTEFLEGCRAAIESQ